jgi:hypothetical protein
LIPVSVNYALLVVEIAETGKVVMDKEYNSLKPESVWFIKNYIFCDTV